VGIGREERGIAPVGEVGQHRRPLARTCAPDRLSRMKTAMRETTMKTRIKGLLERKMAEPAYRDRFERNYPAFILEVQILRALEKKGWTFEDLAKALHTSKGNISRDLIAGGIRAANLPRLNRMAEALGMGFVPLFIDKKRERAVMFRLQEIAAH